MKDLSRDSVALAASRFKSAGDKRAGCRHYDVECDTESARLRLSAGGQAQVEYA